MSADDRIIPLRPSVGCPMCQQPSAHGFYPFCSRICATQDLSNWLNESYILPGTEQDDANSKNGDIDD